MSYYDSFMYLDKKTRTGMKMKGWFRREDEELPDIYEKTFATTDVNKAKQMLIDYAEEQAPTQNEKADPELEDQPEVGEGGQMALFS